MSGYVSFFVAVCLLFAQPSFAQSLSDAEKAVKNGLIALYNNEIQAAVKQFESAAEVDGEIRAAGYYYLGYAHYLGGQFKESMEAFRQAYEISPELPTLLPQEQTLLSFADEIPDSPEPALDTPTNPHYKNGLRFLLGKNFSTAVDEFEVAVGESPEQAKFYYYMGYSLYELKKFQQAKAAFQEAYRIQPQQNRSDE